MTQPLDPRTLAGPRLRASDADRAATVAVLQDAVGRGLLTPDEGSERMAAAFAAVHLDDLPALTADLPRADRRAAAPGWGPLASMAAEQLRASLGAGPGRRLDPRVLVVVVLLAVAVLLAVGVSVDALFDGGRGPHGGFGH